MMRIVMQNTYSLQCCKDSFKVIQSTQKLESIKNVPVRVPTQLQKKEKLH